MTNFAMVVSQHGFAMGLSFHAVVVMMCMGTNSVDDRACTCSSYPYLML